MEASEAFLLDRGRLLFLQIRTSDVSCNLFHLDGVPENQVYYSEFYLH